MANSSQNGIFSNDPHCVVAKLSSEASPRAQLYADFPRIRFQSSTFCSNWHVLIQWRRHKILLSSLRENLGSVTVSMVSFVSIVGKILCLLFSCILIKSFHLCSKFCFGKFVSSWKRICPLHAHPLKKMLHLRPCFEENEAISSELKNNGGMNE